MKRQELRQIIRQEIANLSESQYGVKPQKIDSFQEVAAAIIEPLVQSLPASKQGKYLTRDGTPDWTKLDRIIDTAFDAYNKSSASYLYKVPPKKTVEKFLTKHLK